ncbi:hypothetical protein RBSH_04405 [Rhodopirellula baltica SH28]|uniref:Uncharacterized protein n=1 Tax=Rhodopirellula baltica SH28 TaxID=993517 RepID=K5CAI4_RHOBT|nr:hypothetical protein [Rhodopirellula baltica]EKK00250.1 hypothetical protein RBSH_04405 [Rhodopirellula baltica SH28]
MPLKKLWNSLRGVTPQSKVTPEADPAITSPGVTQPEPVARKKSAGKPAVKATVDASKPAVSPQTSVPAPVAKAKPAAPARGVLSMLSRGEHDALVKTLTKLQPSSILEIGVGDGSRTPAVVHALAETNPALKYAVIDQFEMVGGTVKLRDFHGQLAGLAIRPSIVPETAARGVVTVLHRLGMMDAIILDPSLDAETLAELDSVLSKVSYADTMILRQTNGKWQSTASNSTTLRATRRAA